MGFLADVLKNEKGFYSFNMFMRMTVFVFGCGFATAAVVGDFLGLNIRLEAAVIAWSLAFGVAGLRVGEAYLNRKTIDGAAGPLQQAGSEIAPTEPVIPAEKDDLTTLEDSVKT